MKHLIILSFVATLISCNCPYVTYDCTKVDKDKMIKYITTCDNTEMRNRCMDQAKEIFCVPKKWKEESPSVGPSFPIEGSKQEEGDFSPIGF